MANSIRMNLLHSQALPKVGMPPMAQFGAPVPAGRGVSQGGLHSYMGHFAQPKNLAMGHNTNGKMFIAKATANSHGQFRAKAQRAGMSTRAYANKEQHAKGRLGKQARLAKTLMGMH